MYTENNMVLGKNWITDYLIDLEYKKYQLLGYLSHVRKEYSINKLYPHLSELIRQKNELFTLLKRLSSLNPKGDLSTLNWEKLTLEYKNAETRPEILDQLTKIAEFSVPLLEEHIEEGNDLRQIIENTLKLEAVGIVPIIKREGYLLLHATNSPRIYIYKYEFPYLITGLDSDDGKFIVEFLYSTEKTISNSYEIIKRDLINKYKELPNPAVFRIASTYEIPLNESFLPIAKVYFAKKMGTF